MNVILKEVIINRLNFKNIYCIKNKKLSQKTAHLLNCNHPSRGVLRTNTLFYCTGISLPHIKFIKNYVYLDLTLSVRECFLRGEKTLI